MYVRNRGHTVRAYSPYDCNVHIYPHETALICLPDIVNNWLVLISLIVFLVVYCVVVPLCAKGAQILVIQPWSENPS